MAPISERLFQSSLSHVRKELKALGFGTEKMMRTKASRTLLPSIRRKAYFTRHGEIFIPILQPRGGTRDALRHEYGHALLYHYPRIRNRKCFDYFGHTTNEDDYVSDYAMKEPEEDFCETFMMYLKHKGELPKGYSSPRLKKKWSCINALRNRFAS